MNKDFQDPQLTKKLLRRIEKAFHPPVTLMEVCGTHTMAIFRYGLRQVLPKGLRLLSGPGCPVCVTPDYLIDAAQGIAAQPDVLLATFGDMLRVPGSRGSLEELKAAGANVKVVYSPLEALALAEKYPKLQVVFFAIGFETTAPMIAATILRAKERGLTNFSIIEANKTMPGALKALLSAEDIRIDGLICPGHVSAIIGTEPYRFIPREFAIGAVVTGFGPVDILQGIYMLLKQLRENNPQVENQYRRWVPGTGNPEALKLIDQVFTAGGSHWRGLGYLEGTGLTLKTEYQEFDALRRFGIVLEEKPSPTGCRCGDVLRGIISPLDCPLFATVCVPEKPIGPCMVSIEGTCRAYYTYGR